MSRKPLSDSKGEVRELDMVDIRAMRPAVEVLPPELIAILPKRKPGQRGPQAAPTKRQITLRIKPAVIEAYRATGPGWQTRMTDVLEGHLKRGNEPPRKSGRSTAG